MSKQIRSFSIVILVIIVAACSISDRPPVGSSINNTEESIPVTLDDKLVEVNKGMPGFGGMFFDDNGDLNVYLVDAKEGLNPQALAVQKVQVESAITSVFGSELLSQGAVQRDNLQGQALPKAAELKILKAQYDVAQLADWRTSANKTFDVPGVVFTDLDESSNRVRIGYTSTASRAQIETELTKQGVPLEAVIFEETEPVKLTASLRSKIRPLRGGLQVESDTGVFASLFCTLGFNALRNGVAGFVTNSHCTKTQGGSESTDFHQPNDPRFGSNKVGDEIVDPPYFTGLFGCPPNFRCRFSDSAFVKYNGSTFTMGFIARPTSWNTGSLTISSSKSVLKITSENNNNAPIVDGTILDKIGRTTGWTYGKVAGSCLHTPVADTNILLLCQTRVIRLSGSHKMVDSGDSGSPVFKWSSSGNVSLYGILWGESNNNSVFLFSPMHLIEQELGQLTTIVTSQPPPDDPLPPPCDGCQPN